LNKFFPVKKVPRKVPLDNNPNELFLGVPGSGKSFAAKRALVNVFLAITDKILVTGNRIVFYPVPRFRRRNATAKILPVHGQAG